MEQSDNEADLTTTHVRGGPMQEIEIKVESDHIERLTSAKPLVAIAELIWNSYDADAKNIIVEFSEGALTKLGLIRITDDGAGIPFEEVDELFKKLGGSWKKTAQKTESGRSIHGEKGQGRFKAFALGNNVKWTSNVDGKRFSIEGSKSDLSKFRISEVFKADIKGCVVEISEIPKDFEIRSEDGFHEQIRDYFALQLYEDKELSIIYDGIKVDAKESISNVSSENILVTHAEKTVKGLLEIVEWKGKVDRKLMLCTPGRFSFHIMAPGIQARGFDFTAYLTSDYFQSMLENNTDGLVDLDPLANLMIESSKEKLREYFRNREADISREKIQQWKNANIYPYQGIYIDAVERNERQIFDVVALNLCDYSDFEKSTPKQQRLIFQLLKAAIESGTSTLLGVLENLIDLPKNKLDELSDILRKTTFTSVINASKSAIDRLDFLKALQILVFDPKSKKQLLERSQLHRIVSQETWIFGERFNLMNDDEDLTSVLKTHLSLLGRDSLAPIDPVLDLNGNAAIVDLMLSCRIPTPTDDERKHLIIELKRPSQPINEEVISQIKRYAKAVAGDDRFTDQGVEWEFLAISNKFTKDAELEAKQLNRPIGLVAEYENPKIRVWAKTWGQIIAEAEGRLTFYKRRLEYQADDAEAIRYLSTINSDYLSEEIKAKIEAAKDLPFVGIPNEEE